MVVLADEVLESFFGQDFSGTFRLEPTPLEELPTPNSGFLSGMWLSIATNDNKKILNKLTDEVGRTIGRHKVEHRPAIGRYTTLEEPKARESLLTPSMRHSASQTSLNSHEPETRIKTPTIASTSTPSLDQISTTPLRATNSSHLAFDLLSPVTPGSAMHSEFSPLPIVKAANAALMTMERTPFAIDDVKDEDDDDDDTETEGEYESGDDAVLDEVDAFLEAHDSGLTEDQKEVAKGL
jgi:TBC1 domain family member 8/9